MRKKLHRVGMMMIMMVMVVGFAYKLGKRERGGEGGWLVDESSGKRFGEGHDSMRKMCVSSCL